MLFKIICSGLLLLCLHFAGYSEGVPDNKKSKIVVYGLLKSDTNFDSVTVKYSDQLVHPFSQLVQPFEQKYALSYAGLEAYREKFFRCEIPAGDRPGYLTLEIGLNKMIFQYLVEPGDSIKVRIDCIDNIVLFGGPAANKFRCQFDMQVATETRDLDMPTYVQTFNKIAEFDGDSSELLKFEAKYRQFGKELLLKETSPVKYFEEVVNTVDIDYLQDNPAWEVLLSYRDKLNKSFFEILRVNLLGKARTGFVQNARSSLGYSDSTNQLREKWKKFYSEKFSDWQSFTDPINENILLSSVNYMAYFSERILLESKIFGKRPFDLIMEKTKGDTRDYLIGYYLLYSNNTSRDMVLFKRALEVVKDSAIYNMLVVVYNRDRKGAPIPEFTLWNEKDLAVSTNSLNGKVVFADFWFTGCSACVDFYKSTLKQVEEQYRNNTNVVFLSISIDIDKSVWVRSLKNDQYTSSDAVNWYTGKLSSTHPLIKYFGIAGYPHQLLIGSDNKVYRSGDLRLSKEELIKVIDMALKEKNR
jgi:thiol-disulfide isomerase/thioredoxin